MNEARATVPAHKAGAAGPLSHAPRPEGSKQMTTDVAAAGFDPARKTGAVSEDALAHLRIRSPLNRAIYGAVRRWTMTNMRDADDPSVGYPLVDLMSDPAPADIGTGEMEMIALVDEIEDAVLNNIAAAEDDLRPWGWAPGGYVFKCRDCSSDIDFYEKMGRLGDKRSWRCEEHARAARDSDGSPKGGDADGGSVHDSAGRDSGIAQTPDLSSEPSS